MGPKIHFNFELLDIGKVFIGSAHCYEVGTTLLLTEASHSTCLSPLCFF